MWSVYVDPHPVRVVSTALLGRASRRAHYGPLAPLRAHKLHRPALPGKRWVRVRNRMAGISSADLQLIHLEMDPHVVAMAAPRPARMYLGREVVGEVVEVGASTQFLRPGDLVAYQTDQCCATREIEPPCPYCTIGNYALCENRYLPGPQAVGGGWSDEMVVHERQLFLVPDGLADEQAALLEPCATAVHAVLRHLPQPNDTALVIGAGTLGLLTAQAVHALGPEGVVITAMARHPFQVEMAARMGAEHVLYDEDLSAAVVRLTGAQRFAGRGDNELLLGGFDVVYDTVGTSDTLQNALRWTRAGGKVVLVANRLEPMQLDLTPIWFKEIDLIGAVAHGAENAPGTRAAAALGRERGGRDSTFQVAARLVRERLLTPERLITHRFPLREVRRAVETARDKAEHRAIKVMLDMRDPTGLDQLDAEIVTEEELG
jgi:2-desacetyl-2-hydroxyethyl bacteriochlorophyllide A dehydrogenase